MEGFLESGFGLAYSSWAVNSLTGNIASTVELSQQVADSQRITIEVGAASVRASSGLLTEESGRCHLSTSHTIDGIVDEDDDDVLATVSSVDSLGSANGREVTVALIGKDELVGHESLGSSSHSWSASVSGLKPVDVDVVVGENGATYRRNADSLFLQSHFFDNLGNEFVHNTMATAWAVVHVSVVEKARFLINPVFGADYIVKFHNGLVMIKKVDYPNLLTSFSLRALRISSGAGTLPPRRQKRSTG